MVMVEARGSFGAQWRAFSPRRACLSVAQSLRSLWPWVQGPGDPKLEGSRSLY